MAILGTEVEFSLLEAFAGSQFEFNTEDFDYDFVFTAKNTPEIQAFLNLLGFELFREESWGLRWYKGHVEVQLIDNQEGYSKWVGNSG